MTMKTKNLTMNSIYLRRLIAALISLSIVVTIATASFSEPLNALAELFITEEETYTAYASVIQSGTDGNGNIHLRVVVRDDVGTDVTAGDFTFQWQFSAGESNNFTNISGENAPALQRSDAVTAGYYRCVVSYSNTSDIPATPASGTFESNTIRITRAPNTRPYTAYILGSFTIAGTNNVQVNLNAVVRNQAGADITSSGDFEFRWERQDKVNGLPVGYFVPIPGAYSPTFSGAFNSPAFIRCRVTYIGDDGEPQSSVIFYTAPVNWTPVLSYSVGAQPIYTTSATTTVGRNLIIPTDRPPGFPAGAPFGQGQFNTNTTVVARVNASGQLIIELSNHNLQGGGNINTIGSYFQLHRLTDGETGEDLFDGVGVNSVLPNGNSTYTFTSASPLPGEGLYSFRFRVWRQNPAFDVVITGFVNISATASNGVLTSVDSTPIPPNGIIGETLDVDYPTYNSAVAGVTGDITIEFQHPANSIDYLPNLGAGTMAQQIIKRDTNHTLSSNAFVRPGWGFAGWNTAADGSGTAYTAQQVFTITENLTLFAQWSQDIFTITYHPGNGGTGSMPTQNVNLGDDYTVSNNGFVHTDHPAMVFDRWTTQPGGGGMFYYEGDLMLAVTTDVTLYAQWKPGVFTITYDPNGGDGTMDTSVVNSGADYNVKANAFTPPDNGSVFDIWNTEPDGSGTFYAPNQPIYNVTENITLYAQWMPAPDFDFTDATGFISMKFILLPADTDEGGILGGSNTRVYFRTSEYTTLDDIEFVFGSEDRDARLGGITYATGDPDVFYFYLNEEIINALDGGANEVIIRGLVEYGENKQISVRKIGLFNLH
jgi:uncharacterized repeat protein (TIGR02543 family)